MAALIAASPMPFQPAIWPSSVAKMNRALVGSPVAAWTLKSVVEPFQTIPVGPPGTVTMTVGFLAPVLPL